MSEIVRGLSGDERRRVAGLRSEGRFFWADIALADSSAEELANALGLPMHALEPLLTFGHAGSPRQRYHADADHVVFPFHCYLTDHEEIDGGAGTRYEAIEVNVLVHGDFLLTVHRERVSLPEILPAYSAEGRSEQYVVYAVLDGMLETAFDALNATELALEGLQALAGETRNAKVRSGTLRAINVRLTKMRRRLGEQRGRFERIAEEIGQVQGLVADNERYFERIFAQLNRLIDAIDAASHGLAQVMDLRLNETIYWLTVVATIFLPLTFVTGFFGMNFEWMIREIDSRAAFLALGVGGQLISTAVIWLAIRWRATPVQSDQDSLARLVSMLRHPLRQLPPIR